MDEKITMLPPLAINSWSEATLTDMVARMNGKASKPLILVDGAAGSGKTTLAVKLMNRLHANLVHTDDVSWFADPIQWDGEMLDGIITPWLHGEKVSYRPTGWVKENRQGSIDVDPDKALVIEGMGACRTSLREIATYSIWVDAEPELARARVVERDMANGENGGTIESVTEFADWWDSLVNPLFLAEEPWKYVDVIVSGMESDLISDKIRIQILR